MIETYLRPGNDSERHLFVGRRHDAKRGEAEAVTPLYHHSVSFHHVHPIGTTHSGIDVAYVGSLRYPGSRSAIFCRQRAGWSL